MDRDAFAGLPAELHADVLSRLEPADIARYRVAASASTQTAAHSADIAELAARQALLAFAERTYTDFVKGGREVWTDGTEYSADANDMCRLVEEPLGPGTLHGGLLDGRREWPEIVQVLACDPDSLEPLDLTEGVYESEAGSETRVMMTYDDGEWDGAPRRGIGRRDANIAPLPGETWLGCWAATCAFVAAGTNATLGACRLDRFMNRFKMLAPLPEKGYPGLVAPICLQRRRRQLLWLMFGGADARDVDERAQIGIGVVCVYATLNYVRYLRSLGSRTRGFEAARARAIATAERLASLGRWELAVALTRAAVPEMESDPPNSPRAVEGINRISSRWRWVGMGTENTASSRAWCDLCLLDSSFTHTKSEDPSVVRHVESNIAVSNWFIDQVYAGTVVRPNNLHDIERLSLSVILTSQAICEMYTVVCKDGEQGLSLEEAVTRDLARTAGGLSVQGNYPSALARLAAAMQARARALGIMAQHLGLDAMSVGDACCLGPPLFIWPHEYACEPAMYKVKNRRQRMAHVAKACAEMPRFPDSEFFLFDDSNHTLMKKEVDPNIYFAVEDVHDLVSYSGGWCPITKDNLKLLNRTDGWCDNREGLGWDREDHIRARFREAALAARTAVDIWRAMDDKRRMYTAIAVYGEVSYCHASALLGGLRSTMFADMPDGHQVSDAFNDYVNGVFGLLAVAKWSMEMSIAGLRTFGADAALDIATVQKDLGKVLSNVTEVMTLAMRVRAWLMQHDRIEEPVDHLSAMEGLIRGWLGVFRVDHLDGIGELRESARRHYGEARSIIESHLGKVHPWTRNIIRLADPGSPAGFSDLDGDGLGTVRDEMFYLDDDEAIELFGWKVDVRESHGAKIRSAY